MIDQNDLDYYTAVLRNVTMTRKELEHNLRDVGLSRNQARMVAANCRKSLEPKLSQAIETRGAL